eukprot:6054156-Amphidinium_carterae.1
MEKKTDFSDHQNNLNNQEYQIQTQPNETNKSNQIPNRLRSLCLSSSLLLALHFAMFDHATKVEHLKFHLTRASWSPH